MTKLYGIYWGFYSTYEDSILENIWSTKELAEKQLKSIIDYKGLEQRKRKDGVLLEVWTDGDYYVHITELALDKEDMYDV